ncbi:MAG: DUF1330 domain-containing protein [Candidatus Sulfotelmatobacter sp.]
MKTNYKLALAVLAGASIGVAGGRAIHAQQVKTPPAYVMAEVEVTDPSPDALKEYGMKNPGIVAAFNGHYLVAGGKTQSLEGEAPKGFIVVIAFDSMEKARAWYDSPDYAAIKPMRQRATKSRIFIAEGVAPK